MEGGVCGGGRDWFSPGRQNGAAKMKVEVKGKKV